MVTAKSFGGTGFGVRVTHHVACVRVPSCWVSGFGGICSFRDMDL